MIYHVLVLAGLVWAAPPKEPLPEETEEWSVAYSIETTGQWKGTTEGGGKTFFDWSYGVRGTTQLPASKNEDGSTVKEDDGTYYAWGGRDTSASASILGKAGFQGGAGKCTNYEHTGQGPAQVIEGEGPVVLMSIDRKAQTYDLHFNIGQFEYTSVLDCPQMPDAEKRKKNTAQFDFDVPAQKLPAKGRELTGTKVLPYMPFGAGYGANGELTVTWTITPGKGTKKKLELYAEDEGAYQKWLPVPDNEPGAVPMVFVARLETDAKEKEDYIEFTIDAVTEHDGLFGNSPEKNGKDVTFALQMGQPDPNIRIIDDSHAVTTKKVREAKIRLEVRDYAAYGVVHAKARDLGLSSVNRSDGAPGLRVPRDKNGNMIADAWEEQFKNQPHEADWDDEEVKGRKNNGDNLSYFEEYRGFKVLVNKKEAHRRFSPDKQEIFVCDPGDLARADAWERATEIEMIKVDAKHMFAKKPKSRQDGEEWRTLDVRGDKNKRAVYLNVETSADVLVDPFNLGPQDTACDGYDAAKDWGNMISYVDPCTQQLHLFTARYRAAIDKYREFVDRAFAGHAPEIATLEKLASIHHETVPNMKVLAADAANRWKTEADLAALTREFMAFIVLHEIGHALYAPGHERAGADGTLGAHATQGDSSCPMCYVPLQEKQELIIYGRKKPVAPLWGRGGFCKGGVDDCFGDLNAKNK